MNLTSPVVIRELSKQYDLKPSKSRGQNFLTNAHVLDDIIAAAEIDEQDFVLEVGPGWGALTERLVAVAKKVITVELDRHFTKHLQEYFQHAKNLNVVSQDILKVDRGALGLHESEYLIVANLPYQITGAFLRVMLDVPPRPKRLILMLQRDVAERIIATKGKHSILSLMVQYYGHPQIMRTVAAGNFWPKPKVDSAILRIDVRESVPRVAEAQAFAELIRFAFAHKRKQLVGTFAKRINRQQLQTFFKMRGLSTTARAQELDCDDWRALAVLLP